MGVLLRVVHTVVPGLISRSAAAVVSSFLFCRAHVRLGLLRILITRWETTKMKGGADEDYSFLFKGERVMENMSVSFCHFQKVFHVVHHHQKSF